MNKILRMALFFFCMMLLSCKALNSRFDQGNKKYKVISDTTLVSKQQLDAIHDSTFVNLRTISADFVFDMKYATPDNFLKSKVYDCPDCYLRLKTVKALLNANKIFMRKGYKLKIYDCYRPLSIQKKMWDLVPNPEYVANPSKGSIHNRGGAVDVTLVDINGVELDMGTPFDFFGPEANHYSTAVSDQVKANRRLLKKMMLRCNFVSYDSEWWHYNLKNARKEKLSNFKWECD
jgi:D-alanyl-D-alanine dipeptidase